jgi:signal transduction histidine kinase/HPt (histidine-containing phosphotransfer) domain-containing protein
MTDETLKALLIEDSPADVGLVCQALATANGTFEVEHVNRLETGLERMRQRRIDVVLLGLSLPGSSDFDGIACLQAEAPSIPIVVLSALDNADVILNAVKRGAEDCLPKGNYAPETLVRAIRYAIDRKHARDELMQARDSALEAARLRAGFLANMSHEIRSTLNGVIGMTRLLMDTRLVGEQGELVEILRSSAAALLRIVNDILDFSKISAAKVVLDESEFDLATAIENVIQLFAEQAQGKAIELAAYVDGEVPVLLRGDSLRLCQVLTNLLGNAVKFTHDGEVTVRVGLVSQDESEVVLRFTIRDTGVGIPLEGQRHLFQVFAQGDRSTTCNYGGSGLGLAISSQLVELMGGLIGVKSESNGGSTFWFTARFGKQPGAEASSLDLHSRLKGVRILVVDPNLVSAHIVCDHLVAWGMRYQAVARSTEAIETLRGALAEGDPYEAVLIDLQPSKIAGLALGRALRFDPQFARLRLLGMYSVGWRPDDGQLIAAGFRTALAKPIRQSQLFNSLNVLLASIWADGPALAQKHSPAAREFTSRVPPQIRAAQKLLLVEDDPVNQQVALRMIQRLGFQAHMVSNGQQALEELAHESYDIILMDCQMPEMDGYAATREIRRRERSAHHTTIVGITAHALSGDREECLKSGMDDYVSKPISLEDLAAILEKWIPGVSPMPPDAARAQVTTPMRPAIGSWEVLDERVLAGLREYQRSGEPDFLNHLISVFLDDLSLRLESMRNAQTRGDLETLRSAAHALKGASGELGAKRLYELCAQLEATARSGILAAARPLRREIEDEAVRLRQAMEVLRAPQTT